MRHRKALAWMAITAALCATAAPLTWAQDRERQQDDTAQQEKLQRWLERHPEADLDKDGTLTIEEARQFRRQLGERGGREGGGGQERLKRILERHPEADLDRDGTLTWEEARQYGERQGGGRQQPRGDQAPEYRGEPPAPSHADVQYGPDPANVLDIWLAESGTPTPLVVHIHGGGFRAGDKHIGNAATINGYLAEGISLASINYRMLPDHRFPVPLYDSARALQFLRSKAAEWNIDKTRVGCTGGSAGAGTSLWLAFHDDLADADNEDSVLRESSRITCASVTGAQSSYDPRWLTANGLAGILKHPSLLPLYGLDAYPETFPDEAIMVFDEVSPIHHLSADDPPVMLSYGERNHPRDEAIDDGRAVHHPRFGILLKEQMQELGIECLVLYGGFEDPKYPPDAPIDKVTFFKRHFGMEREEAAE